jgi:hypothetical protein
MRCQPSRFWAAGYHRGPDGDSRHKPFHTTLGQNSRRPSDLDRRSVVTAGDQGRKFAVTVVEHTGPLVGRSQCVAGCGSVHAGPRSAASDSWWFQCLVKHTHALQHAEPGVRGRRVCEGLLSHGTYPSDSSERVVRWRSNPGNRMALADDAADRSAQPSQARVWARSGAGPKSPISLAKSARRPASISRVSPNLDGGRVRSGALSWIGAARKDGEIGSTNHV